jgi:plastocyanin
MRKLAAACALATLTLAAGCGSDDDSGSAAAAPASSAAATSSAATSSSAAATSAAATSPADAASSSAAAPAAPTELTGTVGTEGDPNAFVISLTDSSGAPVDTLPAGDYSIAVHDLSGMHNFHLVGGSVDEKTTVPEVTDTTFDVTLTAGQYTFKCDPHAKMTGSFTVT